MLLLANVSRHKHKTPHSDPLWVLLDLDHHSCMYPFTAGSTGLTNMLTDIHGNLPLCARCCILGLID